LPGSADNTITPNIVINERLTLTFDYTIDFRNFITSSNMGLF